MKKRYPKAAALLAAVMTAVSLSGCYLLPDEEEVLPPPVVKTISKRGSSPQASSLPKISIS